MAIAWGVVEFEFVLKEFKAGVGQPEKPSTVGFDGRVQNAIAVLQSFDLYYLGSTDHHVLRESVNLNATPAGNEVNVTVEILLRDGSGNIDDPFGGRVNVVVIADVV